MNKTKNTLSLLDIKIAPAEETDDMKGAFVAVNFDSRRDFPFDVHDNTMLVRLEFCNDTVYNSPSPSGIRHKVSVAMVDKTTNKLIAKESLKVCISKNQLLRPKEAVLRFDPSRIDVTHVFKVIVRDENSSSLIGEKPFRFFPHIYSGYAPDEMFSVYKSALLSPDCCEDFRSIGADWDGAYRIRFYIDIHIDSSFADLPEVEIITYLPDGSRDSKFTTVRHDYNEIFAEAPFNPHAGNRGVTYAEIRCLHAPFGGMVFNTDGELIRGSWAKNYSYPIGQYSYEHAVDLFHDYITDSESEADKNSDSDNTITEYEDLESDEDFEQRLDAFISSETEAMQSREQEEQEENEEEGDIKETLPSLTEMLSRLTGLTNVKRRLSVYEQIVKFNTLRLDNGLPTQTMPLHSMFLGSPGTGKTTVAKMMGKMLAAAGVLTKGHVVVRERASLIGQYYSSEAKKTLEALEEAQGGILLIDEAYQLFQPSDPKDPGKFVIETLLSALSDESNRNWMLILAGYPDEMKKIFEINPGLKSRIPDSNIYTFDDFNENELMEIAEHYLEKNSYTLSDDAREALSRRLEADYSGRDKTFGNARHVINLIQTDIIPAVAVRVISSGSTSADSLQRIEADDIPAAVRKETSRARIGYR